MGGSPGGSRVALNHMSPSPSSPAIDDRIVEITAKLRLDGVRLDQFLVSQFSDYSRSVVQRVIDAGGVLVNGKPAKASYVSATAT